MGSRARSAHDRSKQHLPTCWLPGSLAGWLTRFCFSNCSAQQLELKWLRILASTLEPPLGPLRSTTCYANLSETSARARHAARRKLMRSASDPASVAR